MFEANLEELVYPWDKVVEVKANTKKNLTNLYKAYKEGGLL